MVDPARPQAFSRRRFLALSAGVVSVPVLAGCGGPHGAAGPGLKSAVKPAVLTAEAPNGIRRQVQTPQPQVPQWARSMGLGRPDLPSGNPDDLLVLSYHNVTGDGDRQGTSQPDHYTVSAAAFAAQMQMLRLAGFKSVRMADVIEARASGIPLPPRSVLVTFDDGGAGQWIYADRVLADVGFTAVTFLITGHLGSGPAYLSWQEAQALARSGRWDVGAHTHDLHHFVPTGPGRPPASVLINRIWNQRARTLESLPAARRRVEDDLAMSLRLLAQHGFARPTAFAYPFSQVTDPTNDQTLSAHVTGLLAATFPIRMTNTKPGRLAQPADLSSGLLPRIELHGGVTALNLFDRIRFADRPDARDLSTGWQPGR